MKPVCPTQNCPSHTLPPHSKVRISPNGAYIRKDDSTAVFRYLCRHCARSFSTATRSAYYRQKKRRLNPLLANMLCSAVTQKRIAFLLHTNRKTVARRLRFFSAQAQRYTQEYLTSSPKVIEVQFDEMETVIQTKLKPVSIALMVDKKSYAILGIEVSQKPMSGLLAKVSRAKYGIRPDDRRDGLLKLFQKLKPYIPPGTIIKSDQCPRYPSLVQKVFPDSIHIRKKGKRGCVTGQGELKAVRFDPMHALNHTAAALRGGISRLVRKTWAVSKCINALNDHLQLYIYFHNQVIKQRVLSQRSGPA